MTNAKRWVLILTLAPCLLAAQAMAGDVNLLFGQKQIDDDLLAEADVDRQPELGVQLSLDFDWPVAIAVDVLASSEDSRISIPASSFLEYTTEVETFELDFGVRKFWGDKLRPYIGGGAAWVRLEVKQVAYRELVPGEVMADTIVDDADGGLGFWLDAGLIYRLGRSVNIGLDLRYSDASVEVEPVDMDGSIRLVSGGTHFGLMVGYHW